MPEARTGIVLAGPIANDRFKASIEVILHWRCSVVTSTLRETLWLTAILAVAIVAGLAQTVLLKRHASFPTGATAATCDKQTGPDIKYVFLALH